MGILVTEATTERYSSNLCLAAYKNEFHLKISVKESSFQRSLNERLFRYISRSSMSVVKQLYYVTAFLSNTSPNL